VFAGAQRLVGDATMIANYGSPNDLTLIVVSTQTTGGNQNYISVARTATGNHVQLFRRTVSVELEARDNRGGTTRDADIDDEPGGLAMRAGVFRRSARPKVVYSSTIVEAASNAGNAEAVADIICAGSLRAGAYLNASIYHASFFKRALSDVEIGQVLEYLEWRFETSL
jgi:hypothetical protein